MEKLPRHSTASLFLVTLKLSEIFVSFQTLPHGMKSKGLVASGDRNGLSTNGIGVWTCGCFSNLSAWIVPSLINHRNLRKGNVFHGNKLLLHSSTNLVCTVGNYVTEKSESFDPICETDCETPAPESLPVGSYDPNPRIADHISFQEFENARSICRLLEREGWGHGTEDKLEQFVAWLTPNTVHEVLRFQTDPKLALCFFSWAGQQNRFKHTYYTYNALLKVFCHGKEFQAVWQLILEMLEEGFKISMATMAFVVKSYGAAGMVEDAVGALNKFEEFGCIPKTALYNCVLDVLVKANCLQQAMILYEEMLNSECFPDTVTFNILVHGFCKQGKFDEARNILQEMQEKGCQPDAVTYSSLLSGLSGAGKLDDALMTLNEMQDCGHNPTIKIYNKVLHSLCKASRVEKAVELLEKSKTSNLISYSIAFQALCKASAADKIIELLNTLKENGLTLDTLLFTDLLVYFSKKGQVTEVLFLLDGYPQQAVSSRACMHSIFNLCNLGNLEGASQVLSKLSEIGVSFDNLALQRPILALCQVGKPLDAYKLLDLMNLQGQVTDAITWNTVLEGLCQIGKLTQALQLLDGMKQRGMQNLCSYSVLIKALCRSYRVDKVILLLREVVEKGFIIDTMTLNTAISTLIKAGKTEDADYLFHKITETGNAQYTSTYNTYFNGLCRAGKMEEACQLLNEMVRKGCAPDIFTYGIMIHALCKAEKVDQGYKILCAMKKKGCLPDVVCYSTVLNGYLKAGRREVASKLVDEMLADGCKPDMITYNSLIVGFSKAGEMGRALELWENMIKDDCIPGLVSYTSLLDGLIRSGRIIQALKVSTEMLERGMIPDISVCRNLVQCIQTDDVALEALEILTKWKEIGFDVHKVAYGDVSGGIQSRQKDAS